MTQAEVMAGIAEVARKHLEWTGPIAADLPLVEGLSLDSIRQLTLIVEIENRFRIRLDAGDESGVRTCGDLAALIGRKLAEPRPDAR